MPERPRLILGVRRGGDRYETIFMDPDATAHAKRWEELISDPAWETIERYDSLNNALRMRHHPTPRPAAALKLTEPVAAEPEPDKPAEISKVTAKPKSKK